MLLKPEIYGKKWIHAWLKMVHSCSIRVCECASLEKLQGRNSGPNIFYQIISVYVNSFASLCNVPCCDVLCFYEQQYDALRVCICHNFGITVVCCICSSWLVPTIYMCCIVNVYSKWLQFHIHTLGLFCLVGFELEVVMIYFLLIFKGRIYNFEHLYWSCVTDFMFRCKLQCYV